MKMLDDLIRSKKFPSPYDYDLFQLNVQVMNSSVVRILDSVYCLHMFVMGIQTALMGLMRTGVLVKPAWTCSENIQEPDWMFHTLKDGFIQHQKVGNFGLKCT